MTAKKKHPLERAHSVARGIVAALAPHCERIQIAGSIRRERPEVGDIEILYQPKMIEKHELFGKLRVTDPEVEKTILRMERDGILARRTRQDGRNTFGLCNKLMVHVASGIPVDLFTATPENWFSLLVCRTGSKEINISIAAAAKARGWRWQPYAGGFSRRLHPHNQILPIDSEEAAFLLVGMPYLPPHRRDNWLRQTATQSEGEKGGHA